MPEEHIRPFAVSTIYIGMKRRKEEENEMQKGGDEMEKRADIRRLTE